MSFDGGLELARVQVAPLPLGPAVDLGSLGCVCGVSPHSCLIENHFGYYALVYSRHVHLLHRPRRLHAKKVFLQGGIFHGVVSQFVKLNSAGMNEKSQ